MSTTNQRPAWCYAIICSLLLLTVNAANAVNAAQPTEGLWWQTGSNGKFLQLHIGPGGYALATLSYDLGAGPTYRVLQGPLQLKDPRTDGHLAELRSPLYRIDAAGCLGCAGGVTATEDARSYTLRFISTTHAQLQTGSGQLVNYQFFPLYTSAADLPANRIAGKRAVLENLGGTNVVRLQPTVADGDCGTQFSPGEKSYRMQLESTDLGTERVSGQLNSAVLVVDNALHPRARLLHRVDLYEFVCTQFVHGGCGNYAITLVGDQCRVAADLELSSSQLSGLAINPYSTYPGPPVQLGGQIRLTVID